MPAGNNANPARGEGLGVDKAGGPVVDPTRNVVSLVEANAKAAAALREADIRFFDAQAKHLKEVTTLRAEHNAEVSLLRSDNLKEARMFDREQARAIREVDQINAKATADQILQAVNTNAAVAERTAQTLAKQVSDTAAAQETRQSARDSDTAKRLSAVELTLSKGEGKQAVSDPAMERLAAMVEKMANSSSERQGRDAVTDPALLAAMNDIKSLLLAQATNVGRGAGISMAWVALAGVVSLIGGLIVIGTFVFITMRQPTAVQAPIYFPAPAGTVLPNATPNK